MLILAAPVYSGVLWCRQAGTSLPFKLHCNSGINRDLPVFYLTYWRGLKKTRCGDGSQRFVQKISIMCTEKFLNLYRLSMGIPQKRRKSSPGRESMGSCRKMFCPPTWARSTGKEGKSRGTAKRWFSCHEGNRFSWLPLSPSVFLTKECLNENTCPLQQAAPDILAL